MQDVGEDSSRASEAVVFGFSSQTGTAQTNVPGCRDDFASILMARLPRHFMEHGNAPLNIVHDGDERQRFIDHLVPIAFPTSPRVSIRRYGLRPNSLMSWRGFSGGVVAKIKNKD